MRNSPSHLVLIYEHGSPCLRKCQQDGPIREGANTNSTLWNTTEHDATRQSKHSTNITLNRTGISAGKGVVKRVNERRVARTYRNKEKAISTRR